MAKCPKCGETQDWWKLLRLDRTQLMNCRRCGSILAIDPQRSIILLGGLIVFLVLPETKLLPFDWGILWFICVLTVYIPFYINYINLNVVTDGELEITPDQETKFGAYARGRRRFHIIGRFLFWGGLLLFFAGLSLPSIQASETVAVLGLFIMSTGFGILAIMKCPFCKKMTVRNPFDNGGRCINCHREIDVDE